MVPTEATPTPGADRVLHFTIHGGAFTFRRPSRADVGEIARRTATKLTLFTGESDLLNRLDGANLEWEAKLEVGLRPRRTRTGEELNLGETAPAHWLENVTDATGKVIGQVVSFNTVDPGEFDAVVEYLATALTPVPNAGAPASSTTIAPGQSNA